MHVIFVCPHFPAGQRRFVRGLKNVGARVTGIVDSPLEYIDSEVKGLLDDVVRIPSVGDEAALIAAVRHIQRKGPWVHHLEATIESHTLITAKVREATGIPGLPWAVVERCRDKFLMKQFLRERGIPSARNATISNAAEAVAFVQEVGYPVVLKPRDGAGAHATYRIDDASGLARALRETGLESGQGYFTMEEWISGHEGFFDTLSVNGEVVAEFISHYYPNVLPAMRDRSVSPMIVTTNRIEAPGYDEVRALGRKVIRELGITTSATHMEWFYGPKGLSFSEIGARPPGVNFWDVYNAANEIDLYTEWARAVCWGDVHQRPSRRYAAALVAIRPDRDGVVRGYSGVEEAQARWGEHVVKAHLPPAGSRTQGIEAGYLANAWVILRHEDYDACKAIGEAIGKTIGMHAA